MDSMKQDTMTHCLDSHFPGKPGSVSSLTDCRYSLAAKLLIITQSHYFKVSNIYFYPFSINHHGS